MVRGHRYGPWGSRAQGNQSPPSPAPLALPEQVRRPAAYRSRAVRKPTQDSVSQALVALAPVCPSLVSITA